MQCTPGGRCLGAVLALGLPLSLLSGEFWLSNKLWLENTCNVDICGSNPEAIEALLSIPGSTKGARDPKPRPSVTGPRTALLVLAICEGPAEYRDRSDELRAEVRVPSPSSCCRDATYRCSAAFKAAYSCVRWISASSREICSWDCSSVISRYCLCQYLDPYYVSYLCQLTNNIYSSAALASLDPSKNEDIILKLVRKAVGYAQGTDSRHRPSKSPQSVHRSVFPESYNSKVFTKKSENILTGVVARSFPSHVTVRLQG